MKFTRNVLAFILRSPLHTFLQTVMASVAEATYRKRLEKKEEAVKSECKLSGDPPPSPPLLQRVLDALRPFLIIAMMIIKGFPAAIFFQMTHPSIHLFNPFRWIRLVQGCGFAKILAFGDVIWRGYKQPLVEQASGKVLEIGAGTGENLKYYKNDNIETLYALEPEQALSKILAENIVKNGFADKSLLIPVGIDDRNKLSTYGVAENTFDTIVLVQVCCSLPNASAHFKYLQSLLKPGGKLIMFEHVASADPITRLLQDLYTFAFWKRAALGCELNRPSGLWMKEIGGWDKVSLLRPEIETSGSILPHDIGVFVKASYASMAHN
ncbi:hypothetical protein E3P84_03675 [Wallemia ichthyophaga]|nr:hypothetical protein E3P84_03675 [Wallemia ichthyophaga]TIB39145.1 hypothetical protein E3P83_03647 [Wallemia ichthyophaga]